MLKRGMLVNDRYEIIEKIGTGGMSIVYKARCTKLERNVAIKVLKEEFCMDDAFVRRFKVEAQSAASLSHSNIVNIFDVGNDGRIQFIVMELLEGKTLKAYIKEKGSLDDTEVLKISACIASALEHAHSNHIIHRDIKPHNIMITNKGNVKVCDFGIARIATDATIAVQDTQTGSVHYISPEQARGQISDEKSDIYSLGITMYEMATGTLPFDADTAVSIAIKHIHDEMKTPSLINPDISKAVEQIILKATQKKPNLRYESAEKLLVDLKTAHNFPNEEFVNISSYDDDSPTMVMSRADLDEIESTSRSMGLDKEGRIDKVVVISGAVAAIVVSLILFLVVWNVFLKSEAVIELQIPSVEGMTLDSAMAEFLSKDIEYAVTATEFSDTYEANHVINQTPSGIVYLGKDDHLTVNVTISKGEETYSVPEVVGTQYELAEGMITEAGFGVNKIAVYDETIPLGEIISQTPMGESKIKANSIIDIVVSLGPETKMVIMPSIDGLSESAAISSIQAAGLKVGNIIYVKHETIEKGNIITGSVASGESLEIDYLIDLVVSDGLPIISKKVTIPDQLSSNNKTIGQLTVIMTVDEVDIVIFDETVTAVDFPVPLTLEGEGSAKVKVYVDDILQYETTIYFE
ncbi:MAG: Stk1 family PASTA domain-containing Ser/Thr kinase [Vallitaleaceae bacterium]|jgi:serine/threonine protein kinase|nr:Stk1 family PASTA domain-containing Ser/Thr kinase [Vallitaleaceae bacterium]